MKLFDKIFERDHKIDGNAVYAPVAGKLIAMRDLPDERIRSGKAGPGCGIIPKETVIRAPFDGTVLEISEGPKDVEPSAISGTLKDVEPSAISGTSKDVELSAISGTSKDAEPSGIFETWGGGPALKLQSIDGIQIMILVGNLRTDGEENSNGQILVRPDDFFEKGRELLRLSMAGKKVTDGKKMTGDGLIMMILTNSDRYRIVEVAGPGRVDGDTPVMKVSDL